MKHFYFVVYLLLTLTACSQPMRLSRPESGPKDATPHGPPTSITQTLLHLTTPACEDRFIAHNLDHTTSVTDNISHLYESNGSGLALNDLDNDGDIDIVLGNLAGSNSILWNDGSLLFHTETFPHGQTRAVNIIDIDGDGWQDIFFARRMLRPAIWQNQGTPANLDDFALLENFGIWEKAYTTAWADLDIDGDLDLVLATYDGELAKPNAVDQSGGGGIAYYENQGHQFVSTQLAFTAQALALLLTDINDDGRIDILVGNDFYLKDLIWLRTDTGTDTGWEEASPFPIMAMNTMSYAAGDINNDGRLELFAGDMMPFNTDDETLAQWAPVMDMMEPIQGDPQMIANVLQTMAGDGIYENRAVESGLEAAGWSWSAKFGDLDNDGFLDFYVVNGMSAQELFGHLPNDELIEENLAFRNDGSGHFAVEADWQLNSTASGRSMSMADLDNDGDLDIVVNNLRSPAQLFENRLCGGSGLEVDLFWPESKNSRALGTRLTLKTSVGSLTRDVRSASGYLSGDPARVHFGFPEGTMLEQLEIRWPDGELSRLETVQGQTLLKITRTNSN